ncbi:MAG: hypothetical protein BWY71_01448 [Planctomycetes bacterium ADurb.Bin412]|nr:MAG: hypothetical protein BWY71_01448 [Planctomycetes bacterium ADurb.Bin412]
MKPDHVKTHDFGMEQVAAYQIRIIGHPDSDGGFITTASTFDEKTPTVQTKITAFKAEFAKAAAGGLFIKGVRPGDIHLSRYPVQIRIIQFP